MPRFCNRRWKPHSNRFVIGDAITPENATKLTKTCASEYGALLWQKFVAYRCTSTFSDLNNCDGTFFKSLSYLYEVVRTIFPADFWTFRNFWRQFHENYGDNKQRKWEHVVHLKEQSLLKNRWKPHWNRPINGNATPVRTISPLTNSAPASERDRQKHSDQTPYFRTYSWHDLPQTLHGYKARRAHPKRLSIIFWSNI